MLRSLSPSSNEPKLVNLCRNKKWIAVSLRSLSHPSEASPTEAAVSGEGSTVLATAVRSGAPLSVIQALVKANVHQVGIVHLQRGSILHEAMKHRVPEDCLRFLLQSVIDYERSIYHAQEKQNESLLGRQDSMGRTALHLMVERAAQELLSSTQHLNRFDYSDPQANGVIDGLSRGTWVLFQSLVLAHPPAIHVMDCDGNTPLVLLLLVSGRIHRHHHHHHQHHPNNRQQQQQQQQPQRAPSTRSIPDQMESVIFRMIQLLVATCPSTAIISRRLPRPFRCCAQHNFSSQQQQHHSDSKKSQLHPKDPHLIGDGAPNPLSYALLYQRSIETIQLLLQANEKVGVRGCMTIVSHYHEVPLHIAVTMRVHIPILDQLVRHGPSAVLVRDAHGLSPLDWCWIRHVVDGSTPVAERNSMASRRRHIANLFPQWHEQVTQQQQHGLSSTMSRRLSGCGIHHRNNVLGASTATRQREMNEPSAHPNLANAEDQNPNEFQLTCDLWHRMQILLPVIAHQQMSTSMHEHDMAHSASSSTWSVLHAACYVSCPLAVVRMTLSRSPRRWLACRDAIMGRLPLHFAASRAVGYMVTVPVGFTNEHFESIAEPSPVLDVLSSWEQAVRVTDGQGQLPLHVAIDAYKAARQQEEQQKRLRCPNELSNEALGKEPPVDDILELLLSRYPEALERRDGKTGLFPFQQAAAGEGASLNTIFALLQRQPTLVEAQIM